MSSCSFQISHAKKGEQYAKFYEEHPVTLLIMPPINNTSNVETKDLFYTAVSEPLAEAGYYVIPPLMAMDVFKYESAYDAELFLNAPLGKFKDYFGADAVVFSIIDPSKITANIKTEITVIVKSTTTNEVIFERTCNMSLTSSYSSYRYNEQTDSFEEVTADLITAARLAHARIFEDMPAGKYHPRYMNDLEDRAELKQVLYIDNAKAILIGNYFKMFKK